MNSLCVITTYFNPCNYASRRKNYELFMSGMRKAGVTCITVECAFGTDSFELPKSLDVIHVRANTLLWQKERLLNLAASWLPRHYTQVAWLDCDILFTNKHWVSDTVKALKTYKVVQMFETCQRLNQGNTVSDDRSHSFASVMTSNPESLNAGRYDAHGHTGYGWAMRRDIFDKVGLYESAISGSADHFMAHAIYNSYGFCVENALKHDPEQISHLTDWGQRFHALVDGSLGVVPGEITHLWHGDAVNRRYFLRMHEITDLGFNPWLDLKMLPGRPIEWADHLQKPALKDYFKNYFTSRREDGEAA